MRAALHRAAKRENSRRGDHLGERHHPRGGTHACRWADGDPRRPRTPRPPRPRLQRRAWRHALSGRSRVLAADTYDYDAYGNLVASTGSTANSYLYTGQQWDSDLGRYYLRARYYDAGRGRFATLDPADGSLANPISLNKYLYGNADPVTFIDPTGNMSAVGYGIAALGVAGTLVGMAYIVSTPSGIRTLPGSGAVAAVGAHIECAFWRAWSGFAGIEIATATAMVSIAGGIRAQPPSSEFMNCAVTLARTGDSSRVIPAEPPDDDCSKEWELARQICQDLLSQPNPSDSRRRARTKAKNMKGLTGGYKNVEDCARGYVSERCGGNPVDEGPNPLH